MTISAKSALTAACLAISACSASAQGAYTDCTGDGWLQKLDAAFAADCAGFAFNGSVEDRQFLAWMFFARVNQLETSGNTLELAL